MNKGNNKSYDDPNEDEIDFLAYVKEIVQPSSSDGTITAVDPLAPNEFGWTLFHSACSGGRYEVVRYLVEEHHVDVESVQENEREQQNTALHCACKGEVGDLRTIQYLIEVGKAKIDAKTYNGWTPLHFACYQGHLDVVKYLVAQLRKQGGLNCDTKTTRDNLSPLHCACLKMRVEVISYVAQYCTVDERALRLAWTESLPHSSKRFLLQRYARNRQQSERVDTPSDCYFRTYPMHAILRSGLPLCHEMYHDCIIHLFPKTYLATMDETHSQLPLHVLLDALLLLTTQEQQHYEDVFDDLSSIVLTMVELEPRAATVKNLQTGLYPFETVASLIVTAAANTTTHADSMGWFQVLHTLLRLHDPESLWKKERILLLPIKQVDRRECMGSSKSETSTDQERKLNSSIRRIGPSKNESDRLSKGRSIARLLPWSSSGNTRSKVRADNHRQYNFLSLSLFSTIKTKK